LIFRKKKYYFNSATLSFEEIKVNKKQRIKVISFIVLGFTFIVIVASALINSFFASPETKFLENQKATLQKEMQVLLLKGRQAGLVLQDNLFRSDNYYRSLLQIDTMAYSLRLAGTGGSVTDYRNFMDGNVDFQLKSLISQLTLQLNIQDNSLDTLYKAAQEHTVQMSHMPAILPVAYKDLISISTDFGIRRDPILFTDRIHNGLDFVAPVGKSVYATGDGVVTFVQYSRTSGYGNEIVIDHAFRFGTRYGHLDTILVKEGEFVKRGQKIGTVGQTGRATGPHLHYEVLYTQKPVNPSFYFDTVLTQDEYAQIINKANNASTGIQ
jgi:murein DD-endopeptidase MepM/ murein hydrolase activator NlpD